MYFIDSQAFTEKLFFVSFWYGCNALIFSRLYKSQFGIFLKYNLRSIKKRRIFATEKGRKKKPCRI